MSDPLAGPDWSQQATTERRIRGKPRNYQGEFESMPYPEKPFYNNDLWLAVQAVSSEPVSADFPVKQGQYREFPQIHPKNLGSYDLRY